MEGRFRPTDPGEIERVTEALRRALVLAAPPDLVAAYLHGSFARGRFYEDIDVGLLLDGLPASGAPPADLIAALERCAPSGVTVDVRLLNRASPGFAYEVLRGGRRLYARSPAECAAFETRVVLTWLDWKPFFEEAATAARKEIQRRWGRAPARTTG